MSHFYVWNDLHPYTRKAIHASGEHCGCHERGDMWYLCEGHDGVEEGASHVQEILDRAITLLHATQDALQYQGVYQEERAAESQRLVEPFLQEIRQHQSGE